jgi:hypothetical protein
MSLAGPSQSGRRRRIDPAKRRWIKTKNAEYWRYGHEVEALSIPLMTD